jgi:hypothetical protein
MISVFSYDKGEFMPAFWVDNGLSYVNNKLLSESFKTYSLNTDTYIVQGDGIEKELLVNATNLSISYSFTQVSELQLTVFFNPEIASSLDDISIFRQQVTISHYVPLLIEFNNASSISLYKDETWNLVGVKVTYESAGLASISVHTSVAGQIPNDDYSALRQQLLAKYEIDYIVVYKNEPEGGWKLSMLRKADKIVLENQDVAIFKVNSL